MTTSSIAKKIKKEAKIKVQAKNDGDSIRKALFKNPTLIRAQTIPAEISSATSNHLLENQPIWKIESRSDLQEKALATWQKTKVA